jgi:predicted DNA-binding transcriptional regulator AlpA
MIWITEEQKVQVLTMRGEKIAKIARTVGLSRPTIYRLLEQEDSQS